jgi:competence protein ComEC
VLRVAEAAAALPQAYLPVVRPGAILTIALSGLAFVPAARVAARVRLLAVLVVVAVAATGHGLIQRYRGDRMEAYFLAVGQGDATVVRLPGGRVLLVDGGLPGRGRIVVAPMLARLWIRHIDVAVVTHVQDDHWGGLPELTRDVTIGELWHPGGGCTSERFQAFLDDLGRQGVRVIDVGRALGGGQALAQSETIGAFTDTTTPAEGSADTISTLARSSGHGWRLEASWPRDSRGMCSENDRSVVVKLRFGAFGLLLPGDIEAGAEHALVAGRESLAADVIKAPHHGSRTSSTPSLLAAVRPRAAIASAGRGNRYGFPHAEVEARYAEVGAPVFRTDRDGAVVVVVDRKRVRIHGSAPGRAPPIVLRERVD